MKKKEYIDSIEIIRNHIIEFFTNNYINTKIITQVEKKEKFLIKYWINK